MIKTTNDAFSARSFERRNGSLVFNIRWQTVPYIMVPLELLKENKLQIKQMLKNQIAISLCLLANGIPGFPCHPKNICVSYLDTCLQITNFRYFCNNFYKLQPTKLVHFELCSRSCSPHMRIFMGFTVIIYCLSPRIHEILGHMLRGDFCHTTCTQSLIYTCEEVTLQTERACQVWYASKQLVIYQCHDDSIYNSMIKYVKYRYLLRLPKRFKDNKNSK